MNMPPTLTFPAPLTLVVVTFVELGKPAEAKGKTEVMVRGPAEEGVEFEFVVLEAMGRTVGRAAGAVALVAEVEPPAAMAASVELKVPVRLFHSHSRIF